jgi:hypothetical protein
MAISNFFENSRRYSRLKVHHWCQRHRWQMGKIFKLKNFNNFVWAPSGSRVNIYINFCLQVHFKVSAAWYCYNYFRFWFFHQSVSPQPQSIPLGPFRIFSKIRGDIRKSRCTTGVNDTGGKFAAGVNSTRETGGKTCNRWRWYRRQFATGVIDTGGKWDTLGLGGNWLMKKTRSEKSRDTVPLNAWFKQNLVDLKLINRFLLICLVYPN